MKNIYKNTTKIETLVIILVSLLLVAVVTLLSSIIFMWLFNIIARYFGFKEINIWISFAFIFILSYIRGYIKIGK